MQNDKLSLIKQLKKIIPFVFKYSPYYKVPNKKKNVKLHWGQQQITLIKFSFSLLLHSTHVSPNQDQICKDDKCPIKSKFNCTGLDNKDVAITRASSFLSVDNVRFLHFAWGRPCLSHRTRLPTDVASEMHAISRNPCNFSFELEISIFLGLRGLIRAGAGLTIRFGSTSFHQGEDLAIAYTPTRIASSSEAILWKSNLTIA